MGVQTEVPNLHSSLFILTANFRVLVQIRLYCGISQLSSGEYLAPFAHPLPMPELPVDTQTCIYSANNDGYTTVFQFLQQFSNNSRNSYTS